MIKVLQSIAQHFCLKRSNFRNSRIYYSKIKKLNKYRSADFWRWLVTHLWTCCSTTGPFLIFWAFLWYTWCDSRVCAVLHKLQSRLITILKL